MGFRCDALRGPTFVVVEKFEITNMRLVPHSKREGSFWGAEIRALESGRTYACDCVFGSWSIYEVIEPGEQGKFQPGQRGARRELNVQVATALVKEMRLMEARDGDEYRSPRLRSGRIRMVNAPAEDEEDVIDDDGEDTGELSAEDGQLEAA